MTKCKHISLEDLLLIHYCNTNIQYNVIHPDKPLSYQFMRYCLILFDSYLQDFYFISIVMYQLEWILDVLFIKCPQ